MLNIHSANKRVAFIKSRGMCGENHPLVIREADGSCPICSRITQCAVDETTCTSKMKFDVAKVVINYHNRFLKSVIHDLLVRYGKRDILYIIAECIPEIEPDKPLLITTEDDGSRWVQLEDYMYLQGKLSKAGACTECGEYGLHNYGCPEIEEFIKMCPENTSRPTKRAADLATCSDCGEVLPTHDTNCWRFAGISPIR